MTANQNSKSNCHEMYFCYIGCALLVVVVGVLKVINLQMQLH